MADLYNHDFHTIILLRSSGIIILCTHTINIIVVIVTQNLSVFLGLGMSVQTETVLQQAITERIKPVVFLDNMEQALVELQLRQEDLYQALHRIVESFNTVIAMYVDEGGPMGPVMVRRREFFFLVGWGGGGRGSGERLCLHVLMIYLHITSC